MNEVELSRLLVAIVSLLVLGFGLGRLAERVWLPRVVGEILGGLVLGPSVLGALWPTAHAALFGDAGQTMALEGLYWIGLLLLMFAAGFRLQRGFSADDRRMIATILAAASVPPFALGVAAAGTVTLAAYMGDRSHTLAYALVIGVACAVTSIPVISKIFHDLGILETRLAKVVIGSAMLQDLLLWTILAVATGLVGAVGTDSLWGPTRTALTTLAFLGLSLWLSPPLLKLLARRMAGRLTEAAGTGYVLAVCFVFAAITGVLGVNPIFGALIGGIAVGALPDEPFARIRDRISNVSLGFFVPLYFALVGARIDLPAYFDARLVVAFVAVTSAVKIGSVLLAAMAGRRDALTSLHLGVAMNTRGGPGIVLASVAYGYGIIDGRMVVALVLASLLTSAFTGVWFRIALARGWPLYR